MESKHDILDNDINPLLEKLESLEVPDSEVWSEIWDTVHHQGDIWVSSYIFVPKIFKIYKEKNWLDYNLPGVLAVIENCRQQDESPQLPDWLKEDYFKTLHFTVQYCAENISIDWDRDLLISFLQLTCAIKKNKGLYEILEISSGSEYDEKYLLELYNESE